MSFEFQRDGVTYRVRTEVGEGPARVIVQETEQPVTSMEPNEEGGAA